MTDDPTKQTGDTNSDLNGNGPDDAGQDGGNNQDPQNQGGDGGDTGKNEPKKIEVTTDVLRAFRDEIKSLKDQNQLYATQLQMAQAGSMAAQGADPNAASINNAQGTEHQANVDGGEITFDIGDDDVVTGAELKRIVKSIQGNAGKQSAEVSPEIAKKLAMLELGQTDPQWETTIKKYLPEMVNSNPDLFQLIRVAGNPLKAALQVAKLNPKYQAAQKNNGQDSGDDDDVMTQIDKIIENANKPSGGGEGAAGAGVQAGDKFTQMSDDDFDAHVQKVLSGTL